MIYIYTCTHTTHDNRAFLSLTNFLTAGEKLILWIVHCTEHSVGRVFLPSIYLRQSLMPWQVLMLWGSFLCSTLCVKGLIDFHHQLPLWGSILSRSYVAKGLLEDFHHQPPPLMAVTRTILV